MWHVWHWTNRQVFNKERLIDMRVLPAAWAQTRATSRPTRILCCIQQIKEEAVTQEAVHGDAVRRGDMTPEEAEALLDDFSGFAQEAFERTSDLKQKEEAELLERFHSGMYEGRRWWIRGPAKRMWIVC